MRHQRTVRVSRLMAMPVFQQMTVRSWRTATRLRELLDEEQSGE
ncbi:hypothetical protein [Agromyces sp. Root81]|nr:hypothetical protein [Agromyces sp. Root81]